MLLPIIGTVATGIPMYAHEHLEDIIAVPNQIADSSQSAFILRVKGDAMTGEGIMPRDLVIVSPQTTANDCDLIIALIGDDAILGRLAITNGSVSIKPSNLAYDPVTIHTDDSRVLGKVIGLIRDYEGAAF